MSTGQRIAQLRKARGWTQAALAQRAGLSSSAIAMYETGRRRPDAQALERIARALEVPVAQLGAPDGPGSAQTSALRETAATAAAAITSGNATDPRAASDNAFSGATVPADPAVEAPPAAGSAAAVSHPAGSAVSPQDGTTPAGLTASQTAADAPYVTLDLTRDEARIILFLRLNPHLMPFFREFVTAEPRRRQQLLKTWDLIHRFQN